MKLAEEEMVRSMNPSWVDNKSLVETFKNAIAWQTNPEAGHHDDSRNLPSFVALDTPKSTVWSARLSVDVAMVGKPRGSG